MYPLERIQLTDLVEDAHVWFETRLNKCTSVVAISSDTCNYCVLYAILKLLVINTIVHLHTK
jgi:uncharacterized protein YjaG (DUF416 family)